MEITNSLVPTLSQADSPNQLSEGNPQAKNAKKKGQKGASSFDSSMEGAVLALASQQQQPTLQNSQAPDPAEAKQLGGRNADLISKMGDQVSARVELSTKNVSGKNPANGGTPETREAAPTIASLFQATAQQNANGTMADAFVAGPDRPWGSRWVFGGKPSPEGMNATQNSAGKLEGIADLESMRKLVEPASLQAQGGDESQLKQAGESA